MLKDKITALQTEIQEKRSVINTKIDEAQTKATEGNIEDAKSIKTEIDTFKTELDALVAKLAELEELAGLEKESTESKSNEETVINEEKRSIEGAKKEMTTEQRTLIDNESAEVRAFEDYLKTKELRVVGAGDLKVESNYVVVPDEVTNEVKKLKQSDDALEQFVTVKPVSNGAGTFPVARRTSEPLATVAELEANPALAVAPFNNVAYKIQTHRGFLRLSQELIDDAAVNVVAEVQEYLARITVATRNKAIIDKLATFTKKAAKNVDDIKDVVNVDLDPAFAKSVIVNQSAYNELDKLKDNDGNYLLQPSITAPSGKQLLGMPVAIVSDKLLKSTGTGVTKKHPIFVGDFAEGIAVFARNQYQARWTDYMAYGEGLMVALRQDVQVVDPEAVKFIEFTPEAPTAPVV